MTCDLICLGMGGEFLQTADGAKLSAAQHHGSQSVPESGLSVGPNLLPQTQQHLRTGQRASSFNYVIILGTVLHFYPVFNKNV